MSTIQKMKRVTLHVEMVITEDDYNQAILQGQSFDDLVAELKREFASDPKIALDKISVVVTDDPIAAGSV